MNNPDVRWKQRFQKYQKALAQLSDGVLIANERILSNLEQQGLIQAFEYTHELAWNTLKDFLQDRGFHNLYGSKDVTRAEFKAGLLEDGEVWMAMIQSRDLSSHTYNEETAAEIASFVRSRYYPAFTALRQRLSSEFRAGE